MLRAVRPDEIIRSQQGVNEMRTGDSIQVVECAELAQWVGGLIGHMLFNNRSRVLYGDL